MTGRGAIDQSRASKHHQDMTPLTRKPDEVQQQVSVALQQQQQQQQQGRLVTNSSSLLVPVGQAVSGVSNGDQMQQHHCLQSSTSTSHHLTAGAGPQSLREFPNNEQMIREKLQKVQENKERLIRLQEECIREVSFK